MERAVIESREFRLENDGLLRLFGGGRKQEVLSRIIHLSQESASAHQWAHQSHRVLR
jgi:hypothetical protein